jgi:hypothetical protein
MIGQDPIAANSLPLRLDFDPIKLNRFMICSLYWSMISSENRLFRIMLYVRSTATTDATAAINASTVAAANHRVCRRASCRS